MARIRRIEIRNFRGIRNLAWNPLDGVNCLIGPGDVGKSTVLDAVELCLRPLRSTRFTDADFFRTDSLDPIIISVTVGDLDKRFLRVERYGLYLRAFDVDTQTIEDEPRSGAENVLTVRLTVAKDLVPSWDLVSDRAQEDDRVRSLSYADALQLAPIRLGALADYHLGWRDGSVLSRVSVGDVPMTASLADVARSARRAFGGDVEGITETLRFVEDTATSLGVPFENTLRAMLDANAVSLSGGSVSLHDDAGVPLRNLGTGSLRLLIAGLQAYATDKPNIILIDEVEYGLEPHRIVRLLDALGAKASEPRLQAIMSTHSPVVLRELSGRQLFVLRRSGERHTNRSVGDDDQMQGTMRLYPEAFLSTSVLLCEGATEVGLIRGLDRFKTRKGHTSIAARGTSLVDCGGGGPDVPFQRGLALAQLGYRVGLLRDADQNATEDVVQEFREAGGAVFSWSEGLATEDALFRSLSVSQVVELLERAVTLHGRDLVDEHIRSASNGAVKLDDVLQQAEEGRCADDVRTTLGTAAKSKRSAWFKSITAMEAAAHDIVAPGIGGAEEDFVNTIKGLFLWARNDGG